MPKWLRALIAGYGAKKLGGGCLSTILIFFVIYWALGQCNRPATQRTEIKTGQPVRKAALLKQEDLLTHIAFAGVR